MVLIDTYVKALKTYMDENVKALYDEDVSWFSSDVEEKQMEHQHHTNELEESLVMHVSKMMALMVLGKAVG